MDEAVILKLLAMPLELTRLEANPREGRRGTEPLEPCPGCSFTFWELTFVGYLVKFSIIYA